MVNVTLVRVSIWDMFIASPSMRIRSLAKTVITIGQENRGSRKGVPTIGDNVWIGVNATIIGKITIGDDVLIAPNSYVNCDVPSHSVVFGNPCTIKPKVGATDGYINHKCSIE